MPRRKYARKKAPADARSLSAHQVAHELQVSPGTLANWRSQGYGPAFFKLGRAVRYARDEIDAWLRERRASSTRS